MGHFPGNCLSRRAEREDGEQRKTHKSGFESGNEIAKLEHAAPRAIDPKKG
jgi:hypothetical protein